MTERHPWWETRMTGNSEPYCPRCEQQNKAFHTLALIKEEILATNTLSDTETLHNIRNILRKRHETV